MEKGHLRRLPRLRRADRAGPAERDSLDPRLHHLQGKTKRVKATELLDFLREFYRDKLTMLRRHVAVGPLRQRLRLQQHLSVRHRPRGDARQLGARRDSRRERPAHAPVARKLTDAGRAGSSVGQGAQAAVIGARIATRAQAFVDKWRPRVDALDARPPSHDAQRHPRRNARAQALLRAGRRRPDRPARQARRRRWHWRGSPARPGGSSSRAAVPDSRSRSRSAATSGTAAPRSPSPSIACPRILSDLQSPRSSKPSRKATGARGSDPCTSTPLSRHDLARRGASSTNCWRSSASSDASGPIPGAAGRSTSTSSCWATTSSTSRTSGAASRVSATASSCWGRWRRWRRAARSGDRTAVGESGALLRDESR